MSELTDSRPRGREIEAPSLQTSIKLDTVFLGGLLLLAMLAATFAAAEIVLPVVLAFVLSAVFQPFLRFLMRLRIPRAAGALLIVLSLVSVFVVVGLLLSSPIADWIANLPQTLPKLEQRLRFLSTPIKSLQSAMSHIQNLDGGGNGQQAVAVQQASDLPERLLATGRTVVSGAFTTMLVLFFVLVSGEQFLRRFVEILPDFKSKRKAVDISQEIEHDISIYLATITGMNATVGIATAGMAWATGLGSPLLWGTVAFLLNYVPILGPSAGVLLFLVTGLVTIDPLWQAFLPAGLYLLIHVAEGETVTPMLLAARFTVNPVIVMLGVIFWYWMWGVCGAILATPMLAIIKIVCDRIDGLKPVGHFIGGGHNQHRRETDSSDATVLT
ncbi:MAG TPA: AI-2E family transporter [Stellaceae bacterium]|jgi:predicted PurR-regulated permease PerM|nr:AI-2E family transporter [Stellaceae bacterium]